MNRRQSNRQRILQGAAEILSDSQLDAFTVDSISRHLQMSRSTLYRYFASKERVLETLVNDACDVVDRHSAVLAVGERPGVDAELAQLGALLVRYASALPRALAVRRDALPSTAQARLMVTRVAIRSAGVRVIHAAIAAGRMPPCDVEAVMGGLLASVDSVMQTIAARDGEDARASVVRQLVGFWQTGVLTDTEASNRPQPQILRG